MSPSIEFDRWKHLYAGRASSMRSSPIRDLFSATSRPEVISLAGGMPCTEPIGYERVAKAARDALALDGDKAMNYGVSEGHRPLKFHIKALMAQECIHVEEDDLIITQGAQQALEFTANIFVDPGDLVIVEAPSYVGALQAFSGAEPTFLTVPMDEDGMDVDALEATLAAQDRPVKFIYTVPNFQNPAGVTLSLSRRVRLLELARRHGVIVVEDNPYGRLRYEGESVPSLRSMDEDVIYLGTFSKVFAPGLRLGWVSAPHPILEKYIHFKQAADLCSSNFAQYVLDRYFHENLWTKNVDALCAIYLERRDAMLEALEEHFPPEATWTRPQGGFFVWVTLPEWLDTGEMLAKAANANVAYVPGAGFYPPGGPTNSMRLNFSYPTPDQIREGVRRLGKVIKEQMALYRSLVGMASPGPQGPETATDASPSAPPFPVTPTEAAAPPADEEQARETQESK